MKRIFNKIILLMFTVYFVSANIFAQETNKITGTIGNEKMGDDKIVICVYGTAACMPVNIDTNMTVKFQDKETKLTELPFGLYIEANIARDKSGINVVKKIVIDENKTVICLTELKEEQHKKLNELLTSLKGINKYELNTKSNQIFIEFNSNDIAYKDLENKIKEAGFELE
ncbi:MAG: hypothetical protein KGZ85_03325 [Ignavibacterium sp.]|nr:hypothetical protein [Ignavibacterium sp.]